MGGGAVMSASWVGAIPLLVGAGLSIHEIQKNSEK